MHQTFQSEGVRAVLTHRSRDVVEDGDKTAPIRLPDTASIIAE